MAKRLSKAERAELRTATIRQRVLDIFSGAVGSQCVDDSNYSLRETVGIADFARAVGAITDVFAPLGRDDNGQAKALWPHCWGQWDTIDDVVDWLDTKAEVTV